MYVSHIRIMGMLQCVSKVFDEAPVAPDAFAESDETLDNECCKVMMREEYTCIKEGL